MKNKTQRIALVAVLALAGGAYGVDHFLLGPAAPAAPAATARAEIAAEPAKAPTIAAAAVAPATATTTSATTSAVTEKLAALSASQNSEPGDAFAMPQTWLAAAFPPPEPTPVIAAAAEKAVIEDGKFTLSSIFSASDPNATAARINNHLVKFGEKINGYTLVGVGTNTDNTPYAMLLGPKGLINVSLKSAENVRPDIADAEPTTSHDDGTK